MFGRWSCSRPRPGFDPQNCSRSRHSHIDRAAGVVTCPSRVGERAGQADQDAAEQTRRDLYDLCHTYATFALRAGVPEFALARLMGTTIAMIDLYYAHLAVDNYQHAVSLLDA